MKHFRVTESNLPTKLSVIFSDEIANLIDDIDFHNQFETEKIKEWHNYIEGMISWISNPTIAWDNTNQYQHDYENNITHIRDNGYDVTFVMDTSKSCILITNADLKYEDFGLKNPSLYEGKLYNQKSHKRSYVISESQLHSIIRETLRRVLLTA